MGFIWDLRQEHRRAVSVPVVIQIQLRQYRGWSVDLSEYGMGITCPVTLLDGEEIELFFAGHESRPMHVKAVVRHSNGFRHGVEFVEISASDRDAIKMVRPVARNAAEQRSY